MPERFTFEYIKMLPTFEYIYFELIVQNNKFINNIDSVTQVIWLLTVFTNVIFCWNESMSIRQFKNNCGSLSPVGNIIVIKFFSDSKTHSANLIMKNRVEHFSQREHNISVYQRHFNFVHSPNKWLSDSERKFNGNQNSLIFYD